MPISIRQQAEDARDAAYYAIVGNMNRAERRTAKGKLIEAQAKIAGLEAENKFLREQQEDW